MKQHISISGMHCGSCVDKVKKALESNYQVDVATVDVATHSAQLEVHMPLSNSKLNTLLSAAGTYSLVQQKETIASADNEALEKGFFNTYKPLLLIVTFLLGISILVQFPLQDFNLMLLMRHFMAGFFIVFAFFKLLNIKGFASSYAMYDVVASRWKGWGFVYPFVELALGVAYLLNIFPTTVNWVTIIVLGISSIGVIESNLNKRKIKCACLGDVFNLPMSTVTIVEDLSMVAMAALMLIL